ncbi:MAG: DUF1295 domain-containing protein [Chloroflexi bacterium]|nr:DUF1295 domain-containing protein [Chloroflexota bacterium]
MWIILLAMLGYGVLHTWLAGAFKPVFRSRFGDRAYEGLYRILFNVIAAAGLGAIGLLMILLDAREPVIWILPASLEPVLIAIQAVGIVGAVVSLLQVDLGRFAGLSQLRAYLAGDPLPLPPEPLRITGIYRWVRHPLYLFSLMALWPVTVMRGAYLGFCIGATIYFVVGSLYEERRMIAVFGDEYREYQRQTAWLIPFVRLPQRGS